MKTLSDPIEGHPDGFFIDGQGYVKFIDYKYADITGHSGVGHTIFTQSLPVSPSRS